MVGVAGFEPATLWSQTRCATRLRYTPSEFVIAVLLMFSIERKNKIIRKVEIIDFTFYILISDGN